MRITAIVEDRRVSVETDGNPVYGRGKDSFEWTLDEEWSDLTLTAFFAQTEHVRPMLLDGLTGESSELPDLCAGSLRIAFEGVADGVLLRTERMAKPVTIKRHGATTTRGDEAEEQTVWNKLLEAAQYAAKAGSHAIEAKIHAENVANKIQAKLDAGEFKGDPGSDATATEVQINGTSITADGVANIPIAGSSAPGVVMISGGGLVRNGVTGWLRLDKATDSYITARVDYSPIVPANLDFAVKAAMTDGKGAAWTDAEKKAAANRIGLGWTLVKSETTSAASSRLTAPGGYAEYILCIEFPSAPAAAANMFTYYGNETVLTAWTAVNMRVVTIRVSMLDGAIFAQSCMGATRNPQGSSQFGTLETDTSDASKELVIGFSFPVGTTLKAYARI